MDTAPTTGRPGAAGPAAEPAGQPAGQPSPAAAAGPVRSGRSARDMALSMAVLLVPIFLLLLGYRVFFAGDAPVGVDAGQVYDTARHDAHFPVRQPRDLPSGWVPIAAKFGAEADGSVLRVSYVPPDRSGIQLVESDRPVNALLPAELGADAQPGNLTDIGGRQWRQYPQVQGGGRALVLAEDGRTTILTGTAEDSTMRTFAAALR
jgi:Protein of unknown function (DUF4245)